MNTIQVSRNGAPIQGIALYGDQVAGNYYAFNAPAVTALEAGTITVDGTVNTVFGGENVVIPNEALTFVASNAFRAGGNVEPRTVADLSGPASLTVEQFVTPKGQIKYGFSDGQTAGDVVPKDYNGGAQDPDGFSIIEFSANPVNSSVFVFVRPSENVNHKYLIIDGVVLKRVEDGFEAKNTQLARKIIAAQGSTLQLTCTFV